MAQLADHLYQLLVPAPPAHEPARRDRRALAQVPDERRRSPLRREGAYSLERLGESQQAAVPAQRLDRASDEEIFEFIDQLWLIGSAFGEEGHMAGEEKLREYLKKVAIDLAETRRRLADVEGRRDEPSRSWE